MVKIMYYERKVEPSSQSQMTSFPLQWELGCKFLCSLPLPSTWLKERVGLGRIQEPFHTRGTLRFPFGRVPDDPDHSTQAFGKTPLALPKASLLASSTLLPEPPEQLTFFCKSIIRKGGEKSYNETKTFNFDMGAQCLLLSFWALGVQAEAGLGSLLYW